MFPLPSTIYLQPGPLFSHDYAIHHFNMPKRVAQTETAASIELDAKKRVSVRLFNGIKLVDIREFYEDLKTGEFKPGAKGIALNEETWKKLLEAKDEITAALMALEKKAEPPAKKARKELKSEATVNNDEDEK